VNHLIENTAASLISQVRQSNGRRDLATGGHPPRFFFLSKEFYFIFGVRALRS
jgi:hypothetical protein